ncbi:hypothetical protein DVJ77_17630 [Dyella tabacisoli]|uniref:Uncharacterized protein n=2 Tax=Dyella tabacisoli TaxID=2282381 RepID=A0A369UL88_9GAMM|nr:hypothetical protein DVJ77_17630 [Dyella tabacisoli]
MNHRTYLITALALALAPLCAPVFAADQAPPGHGLRELSDTEMSTMRGRYSPPGGTSVAWFGVSMISTWQTATNQLLQSTLTLNMDFRKDQPQISFQPNVTITSVNAPLPPTTTNPTPPTAPSGPSRSVDSSGLANAGGVVQSVQIAGDSNHASNTTRLNVQDGGTPPAPSSPSTTPTTPTAPSNALATISKDGATATASYAGDAASVRLTIQGQGAVEQWIRNGSLGQSVTLSSDNQMVSNQMQIDLIRRAVATNIQLAQNVAQAINLTHGVSGR